MVKRSATFELALMPRDPRLSVYRWLYSALRAAILEGRLHPGVRLPATRDLATQYRLSRGTIVNAVEQLKSEGYVQARMGSGTYVSNTLPDELFRVAANAEPTPPLPAHHQRNRTRKFSNYAQRVHLFPNFVPRPTRAFRPNLPALDLFPTTLWAQVAARRHAPLMEQVVLCDFITAGHFGRHLRHMRQIYAERLNVLLHSARQNLSGLLAISGIEAGLQTVGWLQRGINAESAAEAAAERNVEVTPLSIYAQGNAASTGLQLGFAAIDVKEIRRGVQDLAIALEQVMKSTNRRQRE